MKTPSFWQNRNLISLSLYPLGLLYGLITSARANKKPDTVSKPVICIGNLTAGGTGKTPVAISFSKLIKNKKIFFISRGYGGSLKDIIVDKNTHSPKEVGDEPLLLAEYAPVVINPNRYQAAQKAIKNGAEIIIMDDGFQNPKLKKDLSFIVIDGEFGIGNGFSIPAGPLRESIKSGTKRADALIILGRDKQSIAKKTKLPVFYGSIVPQKPDTKNKNIIAFAGIGRPQKLYNSLKELGFNLLDTIDFPDHHQYSESELNSIIEKALKNNADIFTTSKDMVKIPQHLQKHFKVLNIEIKWQDEKSLTDFILTKVK